MKFNPKPFNRKLTLYLARQEKKIEDLINTSVNDIVRRTTLVNAPSDRDFFFRDYPALSKTVDNTLRRLSRDLTGLVMSGAEWSWDLANRKNDDMVSRLLKSIGVGRVPADAVVRWNQKNLPALEAFENRRIGGMGLSDKVWAYTKGIKGDLELALDLGIGEGMGAGRLARSVRQYLNEPDRLYRRVRDEKGVLRLSKSASNYHPGQGVYRSSYKNAKRLAVNETNMAYRTADHDRVQQIDFILGIEVHLSKNHTCLDSHGVPQPFHDICDELQGPYPKWFVFKGWHPNCRCYVTTILPDQDEFVKYLAAMDENGNSTYELKGAVTEINPAMTKWLQENEERILNAKSLPYWLKDNPSISISDAMTDKIVDDAAMAESNRIRREVEEIAVRAQANGLMSQEDIERLNALSPKTVLSDIFQTPDGWEPSRIPLHDKIIADYIGDGSIKADTVYMLGGAPANGKSTVVNSGLIKYPEGILTLDVDKIKRMIPEYGLSEKSALKAVRDNAANFVHEESSHLGKRVQSSVFARGETLVIDGVNDGSYNKVASKVEKIREQTGLRIRADYVTCDTEESIRRNQERYARTGRLVRPEVVVHDNKAISQLFPNLVKNKTFDELYLWDTNSPDGARLVMSMIDGKVDIADKELYDRFLAKGR